jgi:hypothetical protein
MGNINYKNFICENYYCQNISFKPEWFSENSWNIEYNYIKNKDDDVIYEENAKQNIKPYIIDKGIIKIKNINKFNLLLSKKLLIDFDEVRNISIPINFKYDISNNVDIFIIFSNNILLLDNINILNNNLFYINMNLLKNKIYIYRSFDNKLIKKKINSLHINIFDISIENNFSSLLITEKLYKNINKNVYEEKYINNFRFNENKEFYLSILIKNKYNLLKNEFIELNFE